MDTNRNSTSDRPLLKEIPAELQNGEQFVKKEVKEAIIKVREKSKESAGKVKEDLKQRKDRLAEKIGENATDIRVRVSSFSKALKEKLWDGKLVKYSELAEWMKDNEYIRDFYRPELRDSWTCLKTVFQYHNETGNIWSHLLGAGTFLVLIFSYLLKSNGDFISPVEEKSIGLVFFACAFLCLAFSVSFHLFGCHSAHVCLLCGRLDYTGIAVLITGSYLPWVYYNFYCEPTTKLVYMGTIFVMGVLCSCVSFSKQFQLPKYRSFRGMLFASFGMTGIFPFLHALYQNGWQHSMENGQMHLLLLMGLLYGIGVSFFITRFPECVWPGKFDLLFHSHQIFHIFVVAAALCQAYALSNLRAVRLQLGDNCASL